MKELKEDSDQKADDLIGKIWCMMDDGFQIDEIKSKLSQIGDKPSPDLFSKYVHEAKKLVNEWKFKELVSKICDLIDEVDEGMDEGEAEGEPIHINELKATLSQMGDKLSPELFSKCMEEVKKSML